MAISVAEQDNFIFGTDTENWALAHAAEHYPNLFGNIKRMPPGTKWDAETQKGSLVEVKFVEYAYEYPSIEYLTDNGIERPFVSSLVQTIRDSKLANKTIFLIYLQRGTCSILNARSAYGHAHLKNDIQVRTCDTYRGPIRKTYITLKEPPICTFPMTTEHWNPESERGKKLDIERWMTATRPPSRRAEEKAAYLRAMGVK